MKMIMQKESRTIAWETTRSLCSDPCYSAQGFSSSSCPSPQKKVSVLIDRQPVNQQEEPQSQNSQTATDSVENTMKDSEIRQISDSVTVNNITSEEQCAQNIISVTEVQRVQNINSQCQKNSARRDTLWDQTQQRSK